MQQNAKKMQHILHHVLINKEYLNYRLANSKGRYK